MKSAVANAGLRVPRFLALADVHRGWLGQRRTPRAVTVTPPLVVVTMTATSPQMPAMLRSHLTSFGERRQR